MNRAIMKTLHAMVHEAAVNHSAKTAAVFDPGAARATCLTYRDLLALGNELCNNLHGALEENEHVIGVFCDVNLFLPVWIFGILQVPAAYVPLDPVSPPLLTIRIMDRCHLKFCLIQSSLLQQFQSAFSGLLSTEVLATWSAHNLTLVKLHKNVLMSPEGSSTEQERPHPSADAQDVAYILHTSGTTGLPKIVKVPHKCIVPNIVHLSSLFQMTAEDVVFLASPLTFDPSVVDMFLALSSGACLLMVPSAVRRMPNRLVNVLFRRNATTVLQATPTLLRRFGGRVLREQILGAGTSLRVLALGGEACPSLFLLKSWRQAGNKTQIYNLYGTTEVSCWACCYKLPDNLLSSDHMDNGSVPLGDPLIDTAVEVRDENGRLVTEGEGQVFIGVNVLHQFIRNYGKNVDFLYSKEGGRESLLVARHGFITTRLRVNGGQERVCLVDDEKTMTAAEGVMRATGDWVMVHNSYLYYLGRKDRLVKRHGQMLHLDALQHAMESLPQVEAATVGLHESNRLVAFVVPTINMSPEPSDQPASNTTFSSKTLEMEVLQGLSQVVPSHSIPDTVLLVPALPLTNHGKVAMEKLMRMYERRREVSDKHVGAGDLETVRETLQALWKECLGLCDDVVVADDAHFMLSGGDSLQALRLFDCITVTMETASAGLLEVILDGSFSDLLKHITATQQHPIQSSGKLKRQPGDSASVVPSKRRHTDAESNSDTEKISPSGVSSERGSMGFIVVRRAGDVVCGDYFPNKEQRANNNMDRIQENNPSAELNKDKSQDCNAESGVSPQPGIRTDSPPLGLRVCWSSDTGRCVDASPVLLVDPKRATVFIGSHSHRLQALDLSSGEVLWERVLGDRLESSAAISKCGTLVALGCYDGQVYFLSVDSGETCWTFKTGDTVKSSPAVDPQAGLVIIGSHDGHVYALEPLVKRCVWKYYCGGGAVFSSPCVHSSPRRLYSATLRGQLHCLSPDSGKVSWTYSTDVPFFSSPSCLDSCVCIGSVNGHISALSHDGDVVREGEPGEVYQACRGSKLWRFLTDGPVFSSPCLASFPPDHRTRPGGLTSLSPAFQAVFCGSHDCSVYCINPANGSLLWRFQTTGKVYSSPFVFDGTPWGEKTLVAVASTDGTLWILDGEQGTVKSSFLLPGELFSSPVVWGHTIVVGCRNDNVYCLELTSRKE